MFECRSVCVVVVPSQVSLGRMSVLRLPKTLSNFCTCMLSGVLTFVVDSLGSSWSCAEDSYWSIVTMDYLKSSSRTTSRRMIFFARDEVIQNSKFIFLLIDEVQRSMYDAYGDSSSFSLCTRDEVLRYPGHYLGIIQVSSYWRSISACMIICIMKRRAHSVSTLVCR